MAAFVVRNWETTLQQMLGWIQANPNLSPDFTDPNAQNVGLLATDLTPGSLEVANLEALAMMLEDYDVRAQQAVAYAISESAYAAFGFPRLPATAATGLVTFTAYQAPSLDLTIPAGLVVSTADGTQFKLAASAVIPAGGFSVQASVQCSTVGLSGNVGAGAIQRIVYPLTGVDAVANASPIWGGGEVESDASRASRFQVFVNALVRGTTAALEYAALVVAPGCGNGFTVKSAYAVEPSTLVPLSSGASASLPYNGISYAGLVWLFVDDGSQGSGAWATTTLPAVNIAMNGGTDLGGNAVLPWRAGGVIVQVLPVHYQPVYVSATAVLTVAGHGRTSEIQTALNNAALAYFNSLGVGISATYWGLLSALASADEDVLDVASMGMGLTSGSLGTVNLALDPFLQAGYRFSTAASPYLNWTLA